MPYIKRDRRAKLYVRYDDPENAGELNYEFTRIALEYLGYQPNYQKFNDVVGALEGAKLELYRRMIAPYEDKKIIENGDVYNGPTRKAKTASSPEELRSEGVEL